MSEKIPSGIDGFDKLVSGGFPKGRTYLISGEPGTGKTTFCLQFLLEGVRRGEKSLYVSVDERPEHVIQDALSLNWDLQNYLNSGMLEFLDLTSHFRPTVPGQSAKWDLPRVLGHILEFSKSKSVSRLAIDPIAPLVFHDQKRAEVAEYIRDLVFKIEENQHCTTLFTSHIQSGSSTISQHGIEEFMTSGIVMLKLQKHNHQCIRTISVRKMRSTQVDLADYNFDILPGRGLVLRSPI